MAQSFSEGSVFNYTTTGAVANGDLLVVGHRAGVALNSATGAGQVVALALDGVFDVRCRTTGAVTIGNAAYYRIATTGTKIMQAVPVIASATGGASGMARTIGMFWETKATGRTTIKVKLVGGPMPWA
jgi:predicted RecA/RadA family phage recombinase